MLIMVTVTTKIERRPCRCNNIKKMQWMAGVGAIALRFMFGCMTGTGFVTRFIGTIGILTKHDNYLIAYLDNSDHISTRGNTLWQQHALYASAAVASRSIAIPHSTKQHQRYHLLSLRYSIKNSPSIKTSIITPQRPWPLTAFISLHRGGSVGGAAADSKNQSITTTDSSRGRRRSFLLDASTGNTDISSPDAVPPSTTKRRKIMVVMDGFCQYHSGYFERRIHELFPDVSILHVVSDYLYGYLQLQQSQQQRNDDDKHLPQLLPIQRPRTLDDVYTWLHHSGIHDHDNTTTMAATNFKLEDYYDSVGVYCESDSGLENAELLRQLVPISCPDRPIVHPPRRLKHLMQQVVHNNNRNAIQLPIAKQNLCHSIEEVKEFAQELFKDSTTTNIAKANNNINICSNPQDSHPPNAVVIKPIRGVASESVALCRTMEDVISAWNTITASQIFGATTTATTTTDQEPDELQSQYHTNVLVQEYLYGTEFAIDVVSRNGEHKVTAVWRYEKNSSRRRNSNEHANSTNAPFCYYRTELIDETMLENEELFESICQYVTQSLTALGVQYGVSHNEVMVPFDRPHQPYLIEINCRQHNMDFIPIVMNCIGYNSIDVTMVAYLGDDTTWDTIPHRPPFLRRFGSMVHLVNSAPAGYLLNNHAILDKMMKLESVYDAEVYEKFCTEGSYLASPTMDIRSDAGWVQLIHDDFETLERDYQQIVDWMPNMFPTSPTPIVDVANVAVDTQRHIPPF